MTISANGISLIKGFEGFVGHAYKDPGSKNGLPITLGYGSTTYKDGSLIKLGDTITEPEAADLLAWEVNKKTSVINSLNLKINQNQFDSLASFVYNVGEGAFKSSTMLRKIKVNPNDPSIRKEFLRWNKNDGKVMDGLTKRRQKEADNYFA